MLQVPGGLYSKAGGNYSSNRNVRFVDNFAGGSGSAILVQRCNQVEVSGVLFKSNEASLGGAVYILAEDNKHTLFSECLLEGNTAADGGAVYLNTGPGVDIFNASVFRNNFAGEFRRNCPEYVRSSYYITYSSFLCVSDRV